jgi:hypothetical protein
MLPSEHFVRIGRETSGGGVHLGAQVPPSNPGLLIYALWTTTMEKASSVGREAAILLLIILDCTHMFQY